jgi:protocatechuate 3,4-dioxygenase, beta subunit
MKHLRLICLIVSISFGIIACQAQQTPEKIVGGPCEGCEALHEYGDRKLSNTDTLPNFLKTEPKMKITGKVFHEDGKTPAKGVILYIYQTDRSGVYPLLGDEKGWAKRHGYLRGWVKTNADGNYTFYTFRPGAYPDRNEPEHIHLTIKEPGKIAYYLDEFVFEDDPRLTQTERNNLPNRGGSGVTNPDFENGIWVIHRDLVLGQNIPDYE